MSHQFVRESTSDQVGEALASEISGKNILITGASPDGLGAESARVLAKYANLVILAGRSQSKLDQTLQTIKSETPSANLRILIIDLGSFASVRHAAAEVNAYSEPIHVLMNNAGVMACPYSLTADGFETQFGSNHLAHFLFTALIFPNLVSASTPEFPSRVVNVSSSGHRFGDIRLDDYNFSEGKVYGDLLAYGQSKTANILFANELAKRAKARGVGVLAYSLHPGTIETPLSQHLSLEDMVQKGWKKPNGEWYVVLKTLAQGASTQIVAAFDPTIADKSGAYLVDGHISEESRVPYAASEDNAAKLWELSEKLTGQEFKL